MRSLVPRLGRLTRLRVVLASIAALALTLGMTVQAAFPAAAATEIKIDNVEFESDTIVDGTRESLHVDWSIPDQASNPVTIKVDFPEAMEGYPDRFEMKGPDGTRAGECVVSETSIECTVDEDFIDSHPREVKGSFWFDVKTSVNNDETTDHTFEFGGHEIPVTVEPYPYNCTEDCEFPGYKLKKSGYYNSADDTIEWVVRIPAPADGIPAGKNITITDDLDTDIFEQVNDYDGETWPQLWEGRCLRENSSGYEAPRWLERSTADWNDDKTEVSFESRAGNKAGSCIKETSGSFYEVHWVVKVKELNAEGTYTNSASYEIEGGDSGSTTGTAKRQSGGGDVEGTDFGRFELTKNVTGTASFDAENSPEFTVNYTVYEDGEEPRDGSFTVKAGESYLSDDFYKGTRVELKEIIPTDPDNVTWADPVFVEADGNEITELTFSEENGNLGENHAAITLNNKADLKTNDFTMKKVVDNPDDLDLPDAEYSLDWRHDAHPDKGIAEADSGTWTIPGDGTEVTSDEMPAGIDYFLSEQAPAAVPGATWAGPEDRRRRQGDHRR